ncbi:hypothetical protein DM82_2413 [Burkholderia oklahomensis]|uniref:Uncharacterized protein n=1 Tax=Burkholderia oklahomensis TaxID=342113 RepID=A0AAI8B8A0_9BURK|nr:hypothetical protein DM82_2413 [Burkholderia oklahomensis]
MLRWEAVSTIQPIAVGCCVALRRGAVHRIAPGWMDRVGSHVPDRGCRVAGAGLHTPDCGRQAAALPASRRRTTICKAKVPRRIETFTRATPTRAARGGRARKRHGVPLAQAAPFGIDNIGPRRHSRRVEFHASNDEDECDADRRHSPHATRRQPASTTTPTSLPVRAAAGSATCHGRSHGLLATCYWWLRWLATATAAATTIATNHRRKPQR